LFLLHSIFFQRKNKKWDFWWVLLGFFKWVFFQKKTGGFFLQQPWLAATWKDPLLPSPLEQILTTPMVRASAKCSSVVGTCFGGCWHKFRRRGCREEWSPPTYWFRSKIISNKEKVYRNCNAVFIYAILILSWQYFGENCAKCVSSLLREKTLYIFFENLLLGNEQTRKTL